jgi:hypothetical protein
MPFTRNGQIFQGNVFTGYYTKMKYMLGKHDAWRGAMVWPHHALVKI